MTADAPRVGLAESWDGGRDGAALYGLIAELYPICRSITGDGFRQSLRELQSHVPITLHEVPTGTPVFDWTVPKEWNIRDAYIKDLRGKRVVDFRAHNLHVVNYSVPVKRRLPLNELREHLFSLPDTPDWIPYRTSYYKETWGFCVTHKQLQQLQDEEYDVCIDSSLDDGHLTYGEYLVEGQTRDEVLVSCHSCHPSLCNDNLSGMAVAARLAARLTEAGLRYSYRFLWIPGTIGAITWLALNREAVSRVRHGLVLSCVGDAGRFTYKRSRRGRADIDRIVEHVLRTSGKAYTVGDFAPLGYDERQYCSPGVDLPVGCLMRTPNGRYPEYHTSADDLNLVTAPALADSLLQLLRVVDALERDGRYVNLSPMGEPQLGRRGLYRSVGGTSSPRSEEALLWVLSLSDGTHTLLDIAEQSGLELSTLAAAADRLVGSGLLRPEPIA